jgi:hypothetical protein
MGLIPLGILSSAGASLGAYELIETQILGSTAASITFSGLSAYADRYKHLQIRFVAGNTNATTSLDNVRLRLNADSGNNYAHHRLWGRGSSIESLASTSQSGALGGLVGRGSATIFAANIVDILDTYSSTKNTTIRVLTGGYQTNQIVGLNSGLWMNTASVTSIELSNFNDSFRVGSRFSIYGIR